AGGLADSRPSTPPPASVAGPGLTIRRAAASMPASVLPRRSSHIGISTAAQPVPDDPPRLGDAPLDRAHRRFQHRADLPVRVIAGLREQQRVAQLRRQRPNRVHDLTLEPAIAERLFRRSIAARMIVVLVGLSARIGG